MESVEIITKERRINSMLAFPVQSGKIQVINFVLFKTMDRFSIIVLECHYYHLSPKMTPQIANELY